MENIIFSGGGGGVSDQRKDDYPGAIKKCSTPQHKHLKHNIF